MCSPSANSTTENLATDWQLLEGRRDEMSTAIATTSSEGDDMDKVLTSYFDKTVNSNTIKEKPTLSSELSKSDLLKILSYLEGEVQARDVVIATLKCERVKRLLADNKYSLTSDPFSALKRDSFANFVNSSDSKEDVELVRLWETQKITLESLIRRQRLAMKHMNKVLTDTEGVHSKMAVELEEEKAKNVSSKDEKKLREELEVETQLRARLETELKERVEAHESENLRHKNIVLLLLAERKRMIRQFVEERKRSADLSAMLEEEKRQALAMAEGLEEESQKALKMESELERQASSFRLERERLTALVRAEEEKRVEIENQLKVLRSEGKTASTEKAGSLVAPKKYSSIGRGTPPTPPVPPSAAPGAKSRPSTEWSGGNEQGNQKLVKVPPPVPPNKPSVPPKSGSLTAKIHAAKLEQQIT